MYTYDEIGNPTGDTLRSYTWEHGRQLESLTLMGNTWDYTYDANGLRTKRSSDSVTYEYVYSGDKLVQVIATDHTTSPETVSVVEYAYDAAGQPLTMTLGNDVYYYVLNIQGDVMGLVDSSGTLMISYIYEGYGECYSLSNTSDKAPLMSANNHLLYRGYVMDKGTGLYYLQSRYYDPNVGRFINSDTYMATGSGWVGNNMFAYCLNNPINMADSNGKDAIVVVGYIWDENGLPVVGHISVYVQDAEGNWYFTEYTGTFPEKSTAAVEYRKANADDMELITKMLNSEKIKGKQYLYIEGDFSASNDLARSYDGSDLGGYMVVGRSCLDYVQEILNAGSFDSKLVEATAYMCSGTFVPYEYLAQLRRVSKISHVLRGVKRYVEKGVQIMRI